MKRIVDEKPMNEIVDKTVTKLTGSEPADHHGDRRLQQRNALSLEEMADLAILSGKVVLPVNKPCFLYNGKDINCLTRAFDMIKPESVRLQGVVNKGLVELSDYLEDLDCEVVFVLSHDVFRIGEDAYRYKVRFATA